MVDYNILFNELCERLGILSSFVDFSTGKTYVADKKSKLTICTSLGYKAETIEEVQSSLNKIYLDSCQNFLNPTIVVSDKNVSNIKIELSFLKNLNNQQVDFSILTEDGDEYECQVFLRSLRLLNEKRVGEDIYEKRELILNLPISMGYHKITAHFNGYEWHSNLIIVPRKCYLPEMISRGEKVFGYPLQLYALRSKHNWGMGDFTDLKNTVDFALKSGASFIGVNPLQALFSDNPDDASPYFPSSRLFFNPLYIDLEAVPEAQNNDEFNAFLNETKSLRKSLNECKTVDYQQISLLKNKGFNLLFKAFKEKNFSNAKPITSRGKTFLSFQKKEGLFEYAVFQALRNVFSKSNSNMLWRKWENGLKDLHSPEVQKFYKTHKELVLSIMYQQFIAFEQYETVQKEMERLPIGLYTDMPVGVSDNSADVWMNQAAYMQNVSTGAPPDQFNQKGQDWSLAPFNPIVLQQQGYKPFIGILRSIMQGAGAIRIDHAFGLMRLYLRVEGASGAYLKYPFYDLMGILALESHRHKCLVIAEDLGTAPEGFSQSMIDMDAFSFQILHFNRNENGFFDPNQYPLRSLVATGTHDLPSYSSFWKGLDLELAKEMNTISQEQYELHKNNRIIEREYFIRLFKKLEIDMIDEKITTSKVPDSFILNVYSYLTKTNSQILLVRPEDILHMDEQFNLPGTYLEHPNWRFKLSKSLDIFLKNDKFLKIIDVIKKERVS